MVKSKLEQSQATKQAIVSAAYELVRAEGLDQLSAGKIAQYASISKGGFFHHFPQVDDLYLYILDELMSSLQHTATATTHPTFTALIDDVAASLLGLHRSNPEAIPLLLHFFSLCQQNPAYLDRLQSAMAQTFAAWSQQVAQYVGQADSDRLDTVVRLTDAFFLGSMVHSLLFDEPVRYHALAHQFGEMVEAYLRVPAQPPQSPMAGTRQ